jgi:hypothetical protein
MSDDCGIYLETNEEEKEMVCESADATKHGWT